jgi:hypothetical protein
VSVSVKKVDHGYDAMVKTIYGIGHPEVVVGILAKNAGRNDGGATVLDVAVWNEFGTDTIPARSFLRAWFDESGPAQRALIVALMKAVMTGKTTKEKALELLGQWAQGQIQARIASSIPPPNAPSTVRQKGSSTTLIHRGILRSSISYAVRGVVR